MSHPNSNRDPTQRKIGLFMSAAAWIILFALLAAWFNNWWEHQQHPNRDVMTTTTASSIELSLLPNRQHHYIVDGLIDGHAVTFMVDTGATDVVIPAPLAQQIGLKKGYRSIARTANGSVAVYSTTINSLQLDAIKLNNVPASINPGMQEPIVLLGMSALRRIEFAQRGDILILRQPAN